MTTEQEQALRIEQQILICKNNTLLRLIDQHNARLTEIRKALVIKHLPQPLSPTEGDPEYALWVERERGK